MKISLDKVLIGVVPAEEIVSDLKDLVCSGLSVDSRTCEPGNLYFAVAGERADGHDYIQNAFENGAVAVVVEKDTTHPDHPIFKVENSLKALGKCGANIRNSMENCKFIAVTGSCGKTSTKEILGTVFSSVGTAFSTKGNLNNHIGVPLTLGQHSGDEKFSVIEMGMNHFEEIDYLATIVRPYGAIITSICPVHLEGVGTLDGVREAKSEVIDHILPGGFVCIPAGESYLRKKALENKLRILTFGEKDADFTVSDCFVSLNKTDFILNYPSGRLNVSIPLPGKHQALNTAAALAAAYATEIEIDSLIQSLEKTVLPGSRSSVENHCGITVFNDCYNSSPDSMRNVCEMVEGLRGYLNTHFLLGDMLELGSESEKLHILVGEYVRKCNPETVTWVGKMGYAFQNGLGMDAFLTEDLYEAAENVVKNLSSGDLLVIKGSRGINLDAAYNTVVKKLGEK
ncbi:MAG: UDP-N-acetylmuramoyl-tripeptide--D-alanyl-D-alanine ligase [Deltaproteobacteria bacterium]|nr:UDP-N-acetylmuramoyl-tripeptide--D-alanyl-D-alanine ligase [Deltaproteobacteria bacterium]